MIWRRRKDRPFFFIRVWNARLGGLGCVFFHRVVTIGREPAALTVFRAEHGGLFSPTRLRFSPIVESTARLIASASTTGVYLIPWHYLLQLHCPIQRKSTRCADSTNSVSGTLWMTNVSALFAARSL